MLSHKTWDDYLTESSSAKDTVPLVPMEPAPQPPPMNPKPKGSGNPFRSMDDEAVAVVVDSDRSLTDGAAHAGESDLPVVGNDRGNVIEENRNAAENTLNSLESIDIYPFTGDNKIRTSRERFLLFEGEDGATSPTTPLKDIFSNGIAQVKNSRLRDDSEGNSTKLFGSDMRLKIRHEMKRSRGFDESKVFNGSKGGGFTEPKVFGGNFKYMKGYLRNTLEGEKENKCQASDEESLRNEVLVDCAVVRLQQEVKSCRRKIDRLRDMNTACVRRKEELQEEVLAAHKEITDLKIALQQSCDKQHEFEIEMRIAKARVDEAEREAAIAIGNTNKLERELDEMHRKQHSNCEKLSATEQKLTTLTADLNNCKQRCREEVEAKHEYQQLSETRNYELKTCVKEIETLKNKIKEMEDERMCMVHNIDRVVQEKARCEGKIEELTKCNLLAKEDYCKLQHIHELGKQNIEAAQNRVEEQKAKFEAMVTSRVHIEMEIKEMHEQLDRHKTEKEQLAAENCRLLEQLNKRDTASEVLTKEYELMKSENSSMKDKILYLELYKKVIDSKTLSMDELKPLYTQVQEQTSSTTNLCDRLLKEKDESVKDSEATMKTKMFQTSKSLLDDDMKNMVKKLEQMKEEHRLLHAAEGMRVTPITSPSSTQSSSNTKHGSPSRQSPYDSDNKQLPSPSPSLLAHNVGDDQTVFRSSDSNNAGC